MNINVFLCYSGCGIVMSIVLVGGITRLTESGLSMVEWKPLMGAIPPLNEAEWLDVFEKYKAYPEYKQLNKDMSLSEFKYIFFWEYFHRNLGRFLGLYFAIPLVYFAGRRKISRPLGKRLALLFGLGATQATIGWWMVSSGMEEERFEEAHAIPTVSPHRLATHLSLALVIYSLMLWTTMDSLRRSPTAMPSSAASWKTTSPRLLRRLKGLSHLSAVLIGGTIVLGAYVAGTDGGYAYDTWPLMGHSFVPGDYWSSGSEGASFLTNATAHGTAAQFHHRWVAMAALAAAWSTSYTVLSTPRTVIPPGKLRSLAVWLSIAATAQVGLGIATVLSVVALPVAVAHQGCAVVLLSVLLRFMHVLKHA